MGGSHIVVKKGVYSGKEGQILGGSHIIFLKRGYILGGRGRFCDSKTPHQITKRGVDPGREG